MSPLPSPLSIAPFQCGDEIVAVNGKSVKGERKSNVAQLIQKAANPVKVREK